jgi:hypothetical protein
VGGVAGQLDGVASPRLHRQVKCMKREEWAQPGPGRMQKFADLFLPAAKKASLPLSGFILSWDTRQ